MLRTEQAKDLVAELRSYYRHGKTRPLAWREGQLRGFVALVEQNEREILDALATDLKKSRMEAYAGEIHPVLKGAKRALCNLTKWTKPEKVSTNLENLPGCSEIVSEPLGIVLIISPWNFPFDLSLEPLIGALAAGNCAVLKPSELAPATSALLSRLLPLYLDSSAVRVVEGGAEETQILLEEKWDHILYTGGPAVGRIVASAAAKHLTPVTLELGGKNPVIVDDTANIDVSARRIMYGVCTNAGQACLSPDYVLATPQVAPLLVDRMRAAAEDFFGSDQEASPDLGRIVNRRHFNRISALLHEGAAASCIVYGGKSNEEQLFISPTILKDVPWDSRIMQEETFGPIVAVQTVPSLEAAIDIVNDRPKPLVLYAFTKDASTKARIVQETSSGALLINDTMLHFTNDAFPFGGVGESGHGAYHGKPSFNTFSHRKAVLYKSFAADIPARWPPMDSKKERFLRALFSRNFLGLLLMLLGWK